MLLGDNHAHDTATVAGTWVTYCGSTERASASEREARGYNLIEFDAGVESADDDPQADGDSDAPPAGVDIRRRSLDDVTREFAFVSVDLAPGEGIDRVREQLRQHDLADAVAIVELSGEGEPITPAEIESFALDRGALIARVTDRREEPTVETEHAVSFADPDEAVRERVEEMGLSSAARSLDETIRASKTADSNVRDRVRDRVEELLDDPSAFESADVDTDSEAPADGADPTDDPDQTQTETPEEHVETDEDGVEEKSTTAPDSQASMEEYL
jgi:DNA repair exonuclease SbcCD nuclease subunit